MTLIELAVVMGIATVLMALVLGLSRHVNEIVKIRRAQADLGEWHETVERWHLQFGAYPNPYERIENGVVKLLQDPSNPAMNLSNLLSNCYIQFTVQPAGTTTNVHFSDYKTSPVSMKDPWGSSYIYDCDPGGQSYVLFSCGPDSKSILGAVGIPSGTTAGTPDPTLDDIYFER